MVAATTMQSPFVVWLTGLSANPNIVSQPSAGTGPKLVAKRLAIKVNKLLDAAGAGDAAPEKSSSFWAIQIPDSAYRWQ